MSLYGRSGTGKTTLWGTFPKPILALIASGGKKPGELRSINNAANRKSVKQVVLEHTEEVFEICEHQQSTNQFKTIVLEHATGLQDLTIKNILGLDEIPAQRSWGMATQQQWGQCSIQMKEALRTLLSIDANIVIVAQEREFESVDHEETLMPFIGPALTPSVAGWLNPACDYTAQTFIRQRTVQKKIKTSKGTKIKEVPTKGVDYCLRTGPHSIYTTRFRLADPTKLQDILVNPNYDCIRKIIHEGSR